MNDTFRRLGKDSLIYGGSAAISSLLGFVTLIVITRLMPPTLYGSIEIFRSVNQFLIMVIVMGMDSAQAMFFYRAQPDGPRSTDALLKELVRFRFGWGAVASVTALVVVPPAMSAWTQLPQAPMLLPLIVAVIWCWSSSVMLAPLTHLRLQGKAWAFGAFSVFHTFLCGILAVAGVMVLKDPVVGFLTGYALASLVVLMCLLIRTRCSPWIDMWNFAWLKDLIRIGFPFLPGALLLFVLQTSDRWLILRYLDRESLGVYAVGAQFALLAGGVVTTFLTAWEPMAMSRLDAEDGPDFFRSIAKIYLGLFCALAIGLTLILPYVIRWSADAAYAGAVPIACVLLWPAILFGFFHLAIAGIWKRQKTLWIPILMGSAVVLQLTLIRLWIPGLGILGVACACLVAFVLLVGAALAVSESLWKIHYPIGTFAGQLAIGLAASAGVVYLGHTGAAIGWRILWMIPGVVGVLFLTFQKFGKESVTCK